MHRFGKLPWPCVGNINKEIEESRLKWGSTLLSLTIHFPITSGDTGTKWSPSIFPLALNRRRHQQQYSFTFRLSHTNKDAGRRWPPAQIQKLTQLLGRTKDNSLEPSGQLPISFQTDFDIINTSSLFMKPNPQKNVEIERKRWSKQGNVSVRGRRAAAWQRSPLQIMTWHLESEPVKCQTGYDRNGDRQIMADLWPGSSERSQLTQPSVSWCAFRSRNERCPRQTRIQRKVWQHRHFRAQFFLPSDVVFTETDCCYSTAQFTMITLGIYKLKSHSHFQINGSLISDRVRQMQASHFWQVTFHFVNCCYRSLLG